MYRKKSSSSFLQITMLAILTTGLLTFPHSVFSAELNVLERDAKIKALLKSRAPSDLSHGNTPYLVTLPPPRLKKYSCPLCGTQTFYPAPNWEIDFLEIQKKQVRELRNLGMNISLDESEYCAKCSQSKELFSPGTELFTILPNPPLSSWTKTTNFPPPLSKRKKDPALLTALNPDPENRDDNCRIIPEALWVQTSSLESAAEDSLIPLRLFADTAAPPVCSRTHAEIKSMQVLPCKGKTSDGWTCVQMPLPFPPLEIEKKLLPLLILRDSPSRIPGGESPCLYWKIAIGDNSFRVRIRNNDALLLKAFLTGKDRFTIHTGTEFSVKSKLMRLEVLLGVKGPEWEDESRPPRLPRKRG